MTCGPGDIAYYLDDYSDEVVPCAVTLEGWAAWLSKPNPRWGRPAAAVDGTVFSASALRFGEDIVATKGQDGWSFSREPDHDRFLAIRFGPGLGWDSDCIAYDRDYLHELLDACGDTIEHIAVGHEVGPLLLTYRAGPPRLVVTSGAVQ